MVKALDDILLGFFIFFAIDRAIRLFSNAVVEPWAEKRTQQPRVVENWKLGVELVFLVVVCIGVANSRAIIRHFNKA
ncbi:MAG: hypothetical protein EBU84_15665 [Actinobacteria bacterium]|nr:hypothetical protein [Actinomycetota bacterium]